MPEAARGAPRACARPLGGGPPELGRDERLDVPHGPEGADLPVVDRDVQHVLRKGHDLEHRQRVDRKVLDQPEAVAAAGELGPRLGLDIVLDEPVDDRGQAVGVSRAPKLAGRLTGRRRAALERVHDELLVGRRKRPLPPKDEVLRHGVWI